MGTPYYCLPLNLYNNLESILKQGGVDAVDITLDRNHFPELPEQYKEDVRLGRHKVILIYVNGSPVFLSCSTVEFPEFCEATLSMGSPSSRRFNEISRIIEPILFKHGGKPL